MHSTFFEAFKSIHAVKLFPHFPVLHFPTLKIWSLIFQSCRSVFDLFGPSLVPRFLVLHFQSTFRDDFAENVHIFYAVMRTKVNHRYFGGLAYCV